MTTTASRAESVFRGHLTADLVDELARVIVAGRLGHLDPPPAALEPTENDVRSAEAALDWLAEFADRRDAQAFDDAQARIRKERDEAWKFWEEQVSELRRRISDAFDLIDHRRKTVPTDKLRHALRGW